MREFTEKDKEDKLKELRSKFNKILITVPVSEKERMDIKDFLRWETRSKLQNTRIKS